MQAVLHKAKSTLKALTDQAQLYDAVVTLQAKNGALKSENELLETQKERLKLEVGRMLGSAMNTHCEAVRNLAFQLDGYRINEKTYLVTISPSIAHIDLLSLPWQTNMALMARWVLMKLLPPDAFAPLLARGKIVSSDKGYNPKSHPSAEEKYVSAKDLAADVIKDAAAAAEKLSPLNKKRKSRTKK